MNESKTSYLDKLDLIADKLKLWKKERSNQRTQGRNIWQSILDDLTPIIYNFPRFRFNADEDSCSEYYLYVIDFLEEIIKNSFNSEISFSFFFARALRNLYYRFQNDRIRQNKLTILTESDLVKDRNLDYNSDQTWDNLLHKSALLNPKTDYFVPHNIQADLNEGEENQTIKLHNFLAEIPILERIIIKAAYGLFFLSEEMQYLKTNYASNVGQQILALNLQIKEELIQENKNRSILLEQLQHLQTMKNRRTLNKSEQGQIKNILQTLNKANTTISMREISDILNIPKSSIQRIIQKNIKLLRLKFQI